MFILCFNMPLKEIDEKIELLQINDIYDAFYESSLEITTDDNGYGYLEKEDDIVTLKVAYNGAVEDLTPFRDKICALVEKELTDEYELNDNYDNFTMPQILINDNWTLCSPEDEVSTKDRINFISQGAFGTGLHETTQDLLKIILEKDFEGMKVLDIGTGSGILSIATALKKAEKVVALDIRDVHQEVTLNASLNNLNNIEVVIGDALSNEVNIKEIYDWVYINIGGDETKMFMPFINTHLKDNGKLLVSGLVEWGYEKIHNFIEENNYTLIEKHQSNEWVTLIYNRN